MNKWTRLFYDNIGSLWFSIFISGISFSGSDDDISVWLVYRLAICSSIPKKTYYITIYIVNAINEYQIMCTVVEDLFSVDILEPQAKNQVPLQHHLCDGKWLQNNIR